MDDQARADIDALVMLAKSARHKLPLHLIQGASRLRVYADFYVEKEMRDLDNRYTTILDVLQTAGIIENDRLVRGFHVNEHLEPGLRIPRTEIKVVKM